MTTAIRATYADIKTVRTRKVYQIVFEGPIEEMGAAMALFGPPMPDAEVWAGIARLLPESAKVEVLEPPSRRALSQVAAVLGSLQPFRRFLSERANVNVIGSEQAAVVLRHLCGVTSRKQFDTDPEAARRFRELRADYDLWMKGVEAA